MSTAPDRPVSGDPETTPAARGTSSRPGGSIFAPHYRVSTLGVLIIISIVAFEAMAVATALPSAARELNGLPYYGWAFTGFLVASVLGMVSAGWYCDRRGPRIPLLYGLTFFLLGLIVAAVAGQMWVLVAGRVIQGLATGLLLTSNYVLIGSKYPDQIRPRIFGAAASAWVLPGLLGPVVAGWVTQQLSWRWVFAGLLPFVVAGAVLLMPTLRQLEATGGASAIAPRDFRSGMARISMALLAAAGIAAIANLGESHDLVSILIALLGVAALCFGLRSLLPAGTVTFAPGVPAAVAFRGVLAGTFFGMEAIVPLTMTVQHHYSPTMAGTPLMAAAVTWAMGSWMQGRLSRPNRSVLMAVGLGLDAVGGLVMAMVADSWCPGWLAIPGWGLAGLGAGLALTSASVVMLEFTTDAERGADSAALQLADSSLSALSTAFAGAFVAAAANGHLGYGAGLATVYLTLSITGLLAIMRAPQLTAAQCGAGRGHVPARRRIATP